MFAKRMLLTLFVLFFAKTATAESSVPVIFVDLAAKPGQGNLIYSYVQQNVLQSEKCKKLDLSKYQETNLIECTSDRLIGSKGQKLKIIVKHPSSDTDIKVNFEETSRETKISSDIEVLKKLIGSMELFKSNGLESAEESGIKYTEIEYVLTKERANLKVSVSYKSSEQQSLSHDIITGPKEHLFLSADLPVKKVSHLKYDAATNSLQEKDSPTVFFLGVNYMIGDVISERLSWSDRIFLKGMLKVSSRPLDSFGIAVGYRLPALDQLSVFAGYVWVKEDVIESGVPKEDEKYKRIPQFGISYNLDKALGWTKK